MSHVYFVTSCNIRVNVIFFLSRDKPHKPNQSKPHWFGLDDFLKINRTKPNRMFFCLAVWMTFMLKTEPNRTANTPRTVSLQENCHIATVTFSNCRKKELL